MFYDNMQRFHKLVAYTFDLKHAFLNSLLDPLQYKTGCRNNNLRN